MHVFHVIAEILLGFEQSVARLALCEATMVPAKMDT